MSDTREISTESTSREVAQSESASIVAMILAAARDPTVDAAKVETMANLAIKLQDRERESEFNRAMNAAITEMPVITKDGRIIVKNRETGHEREQGRFARFEDIDRVVKPIAARHGLAYYFDIGGTNGKVTVRPIVSHANGYTYRGEAMELPAQAVSPGMNVMQAVGAGSQYGKRYTLCAVFSISTEGADTDGRVTDTLPFEREQTVLAEAEVAHAAGTYSEFYTRQSPKDRAWLVRSGNHEKFGGQPVIENKSAPPTAKREAAKPETREERPAKADHPAADRQAPKPAAGQRTPEQMVADYQAKLDECKDPEALDAITAAPNTMQWISKMRAHPELHAQIIESEKAARRRIDDDQASLGLD